jgi:hypothetical protein
VKGKFSEGGKSAGWKAATGDPEMIEGAAGSPDGWSIVLSGNLDTASILTQFEPVCLEKIAGMVTLGIAVSDSGVQFARPMKPRPCDKVMIVLYQGDQIGLNRCTEGDCFPLASVSLADLNINEWHELQIPYDLSTWGAIDDCGSFEGVLVRPAIYLTNALSSDQGGEDTYSLAQIDHFCLNALPVAVQEPIPDQEIRIYPNPNSGNFTVELSTPAKQGMALRVIGLTGEAILNSIATPGTVMQHIEASYLPQGMYFMQVVSEGRILAVNKFVKQ